MQLNQAAALLMGVGLLNVLIVIGGIMLIMRNQFRYASFSKTRYDNLVKMRMVDLHNQIMSDLSDIFTRYLLLRKSSYHAHDIDLEGAAGMIMSQLHGIMAHFNSELSYNEHYDQLVGLEFLPDINIRHQSDRIIFSIQRKGETYRELTLCNPEYFAPLLMAELQAYREKMKTRVVCKVHRKYESVPQTYLSYAAAKMHEQKA
ncbi:hypothetical protein AH06_88 [Erwinia phage AH06]|nr:hypothetical protein AH06_88 [Erwinia phage AH06]